MFKTLKQIKMLKKNWNSYGAGPINSKIIHKAEKILNYININQFPKPKVIPVQNNGINLEWNSPNLFISIKLRENSNKIIHVNRQNNKFYENNF